MQYKYPPYCSLCRRTTICFAHSLCIESSFFFFISIVLAVLTRSPHGEPYSFTCSSSIYLNCLFPQLHRGGLSNVRPERVQAETAGFSAANSLFFIFFISLEMITFLFFLFCLHDGTSLRGSRTPETYHSRQDSRQIVLCYSGWHVIHVAGRKKKKKRKTTPVQSLVFWQHQHQLNWHAKGNTRV